MILDRNAVLLVLGVTAWSGAAGGSAAHRLQGRWPPRGGRVAAYGLDLSRGRGR